ncbi:unnamed protein product [Oikopleura dioica]|uniref:Uncharacterized protein n=1 Tax=Oikopleura dioica TaxID=34765 RepID=E4YQS0_OIKDI|nr:unnamed protein product [Oikopleura dioica]
MADVVIGLDDGTSFQYAFIGRIIKGLECSATRILYSPVTPPPAHNEDYDLVILSDNDFEKLDNFLEEDVMNSSNRYFKIHVDVDDIDTLNFIHRNTNSIHEIKTDSELGIFEISASLGRNQERRLAENQRLVLEKIT